MSLLLAVLWNGVVRFSIAMAQSTDAKCQEAFTWMTNTIGQDACLVAAYLFYACNGISEETIPAFDTTFNMYDPLTQQEDLECGCNTVVYSILMACQLCQANITYNVLAWTEYAQNCVNKTILSYPRPVPSGTAIPAWAYQNVTKSNRFNGSEALDVSQQGKVCCSARRGPTDI
ncbi:hypothetical protein L227DRAFT_48266 [Lentinus tigrinus ALCF2SS1-6]|uniref:Uncharacterized protein n=1 Tax=Lentinus tigrinus ALCF2SS1-6 TaxID=1328759 RepID=A0A5C2SFS5_9APHY|nr:hypothetical protein L227DRAFT_48266 [Lentinus tigrinus ALCF2SS1-6]